MTSDRCVVSFAKGHSFEKGLERLKEQCSNIDEHFFGFTEYPDNCPTHQESPFAFKFFCIKEVLNKGFKKILWLDTSVIIKTNLGEVFDIIENLGYFFIYNHDLGSFCHDKALSTLGITREESFNLSCLQGTNFGLNFNMQSAQRFLDEIINFALDGVTFPGPHNNLNHKASKDHRVKGHRHDQTAMSVVALRNNMMNWQTRGETPWFVHDRSFVKNVESTVEDINMSL